MSVFLFLSLLQVHLHLAIVTLIPTPSMKPVFMIYVPHYQMKMCYVTALRNMLRRVKRSEVKLVIGDLKLDNVVSLIVWCL